MSVFRNYNSKPAGKVLNNAFPMVTTIPWTPIQRNIRANPQIPSQPQRIQPSERGSYFPGSSNGGGTLAPAMSSGCSSCGGCSGCGQSQATPDATATPSSIATAPSFPSSSGSPAAASAMVGYKRGLGMIHRNAPVKGTVAPTNVKARVSSFGGR